MANRTRVRQTKFYATPKEWDFICNKMAQAEMTSSGDYMRQMAMKGYTSRLIFRLSRSCQKKSAVSAATSIK